MSRELEIDGLSCRCGRVISVVVRLQVGRCQLAVVCTGVDYQVVLLGSGEVPTYRGTILWAGTSLLTQLADVDT